MIKFRSPCNYSFINLKQKKILHKCNECRAHLKNNKSVAHLTAILMCNLKKKKGKKNHTE